MKFNFCFLFIVLLFAFKIYAQTPGVSVYYEQTSGDTRAYIEYIPGNLPIIISAPHGGVKQSGSTVGGIFYPDNDSTLPDRSCGTNERDDNTDILIREIQAEIFALTGCYAHIIINNLHRSKLDPNRESSEATCGDSDALDHWNAWHNFIDQASASVETNWGKGLYIDLHGQNHTIPRIEIGYNITADELNTGNLNSTTNINRSTIKNLVSDNINNLTHEQLIRGTNSLGELFQNAPAVFYNANVNPGCGVTSGYRAVPSASDYGNTSCDDTRPYSNAYFNGDFYNNRRHGSGNGSGTNAGSNDGGGSIDGIMTEVNRRVRDLGTYNGNVYDSRPQTLVPFAKEYAAVVLDYIDIHYNDFSLFSYPLNSYDINDSDPSPTITGLTGGTFSSTSGLSINASTGVLDLSNSSVGNYIVTYTVGSCGYYKSTFNIEITSSVIDNENPTVPNNLLANSITRTSVDLSWDASTDNIGVASYDIYQNGVFVTNSIANTFQITGLISETIYSFTVKAKDNSGNESLESNEVSIQTLSTTLSYCGSVSTNVNDEYIGRVQLNTIDNTSDAQFYSDFTNMSTILRKESEYTITITPIWTDNTFNEAYSVWIDYNKDGDFEDTGEQVWTQSPTQNTPVIGSFTIPNGSSSGITRMRVSMKYNNIPSECETFQYGEVEDYSINLVGPNDLIYSNSTWTPIAPSSLTGSNDVLVLDGNYNINTDIVINSIDVKLGAAMTITKNGSIMANGNLISNDNVILESDSNEYASIIVDGLVIGNVQYKRHVNTTSATSGNDLIAPPVFGEAFNDFKDANPNIVSNTTNTLFLFGPFDKTTGTYITYSSAEIEKLNAGKGYRAASTDGGAFTFKGLVTTKDVLSPVVISGPTNAEWNLIGNPYPSYINLSDFLNANNSKFNNERSGIYGYDGDASNGWTIWNQAYSEAHENAKISPGQGFLVATNTSGINFSFTPSMRVIGNSDDFILGRQTNSISHLQLKLSNTSSFYKTDFYITDNATLGHDPNYDSEIFGLAPSFALYSHLVEDNTNKSIGVQSIGNTELSEVIIPLGVHVFEGEQAMFSISESTLESAVEVYLEDRQTNVFTELTSTDYAFTANNDLSGTGRFYLRFSNGVLDATDSDFKTIEIYNENASSTIIIRGQLDFESQLEIYDLQGRLIKQIPLQTNTSIQEVDVTNLSTGVYVVKLKNDLQEKTEKIIIK